MRFTITEPALARLVRNMLEHQNSYPGSNPHERNFGLEKAQRDLRQMATEALVHGKPEPALPTADEVRAELGDLGMRDSDMPERNVMYLSIIDALAGLTPTAALAVIERFLRLPFVITEPNVPPHSMS